MNMDKLLTSQKTSHKMHSHGQHPVSETSAPVNFAQPGLLLPALVVYSLQYLSRPSQVCSFAMDQQIISLVRLVDEMAGQFNLICPSVRKSDDERQRQQLDNNEISFESMSDEQCAAIEKLRHMMLSAKTIACSVLCTVEPHQQQQQLHSSVTEQNALIRVAIQKDYFIHEIIRVEDLANQLTKREDELVNVLAQKDELQEIFSKLQGIPPCIAREPHVLSEYIGCYVRKAFGGEFYFGFVMAWLAPWYQVVYEDADFEDLTVGEVRQFLWKHFVPTIKSKACRSHVEQLNHENVVVSMKKCKTTPSVSLSVLTPAAVAVGETYHINENTASNKIGLGNCCFTVESIDSSDSRLLAYDFTEV